LPNLGVFLNDLVETALHVRPDERSLWHWPITVAARFIPGFRGKQYSRTLWTALHGSTWTLIGYGGTQLLRTATTILLARIFLGPKDFGLVALVNVFLGGLEMLSDLGIGMDVVQSPRGDNRDFINTAFWIQACRGLVLWAIATSLAYPFAVFYKQPAVLWLAIVGAASIGLRGFTSGSIWGMTRHIQLKKLTLLNLTSESAGFLISVAWAAVDPGAWALVIGRVASTVVFVAASHLVAGFGVSMRWDSKAAREIMVFGAGIFVSTSTYFLAGEAERLVVGKFVNLAELGCFSLALTISAAASAGPRQIIGQVFFPMVAKSLQQDKRKAANHYRTVRHLSLAICSVMGLSFVPGSRWIVALLLGQKYDMTGWVLQLLGFRCALELFTFSAASMLFATGTSKFAAYGNGAKLLFLAGGLPMAFTHFGFRGAVWVLALAPIANYVLLLIGLGRRMRTVMPTELACFAAFIGALSVAGLIAHLVL
jgi:O-antigen/teichoic acid export membrane protein